MEKYVLESFGNAELEIYKNFTPTMQKKYMLNKACRTFKKYKIAPPSEFAKNCERFSRNLDYLDNFHRSEKEFYYKLDSKQKLKYNHYAIKTFRFNSPLLSPSEYFKQKSIIKDRIRHNALSEFVRKLDSKEQNTYKSFDKKTMLSYRFYNYMYVNQKEFITPSEYLQVAMKKTIRRYEKHLENEHKKASQDSKPKENIESKKPTFEHIPLNIKDLPNEAEWQDRFNKLWERPEFKLECKGA